MTRSRSPSKASVSTADAPLTRDAIVHALVALDDEAARHASIEHALDVIVPDELLPFLKEESERYLNIDPYIARRLAETLAYAGHRANYPYFHALGIMATGDALRVLGQFEQSVAAMDEAAALFLDLGDEVGWARTRNGWLRSAHRLGHGAAALLEADRARTILAEHKQWHRLANLTYNTAFVCTELGRYDEALARYDRAQVIYESLGEQAELDAAWMKFNKAVLLTDLGEFQAALRLYEENRQLFLRHGQTASVLRQEEHIAIVNAAQGHYTRALQYYGPVLAAREATGPDVDVAWVCREIIECYLRLNRNADALDLAEETIARFERCGTPTEAATVRLYGALAHTRLGNVEQALLLLDAAAQAFVDAGFIVHHALVMLQRATLHLDEGNWSAAAEEAGRASAQFAQRGLTIRQAQADLVWARAALARGDAAGAELSAHAALAVSREKNVPWLAHECHHVLGGVAEARGDLPSALDAFDNAVTSIESLQSALAVELRTNFLADKLRVYDDAIAASLRLSQTERAFAYLERAKSRALVDYLGSNLEVHVRAQGNTDPALLEALTRLREEHNYYYNLRYGYGYSEQEQRASARLDEVTLRSKIEEREKQIARILERLALDRTEGLSVAASTAPDVHAVPAVAPGTVLLEYYFRPDGGAVFVVSSEGLMFVPLTARPHEIRRLHDQWRLNLAASAQALAAGTSLDGLGRNARAILATLYRALIAPVAERLVDRERIIVIPSGPAYAVPFHALHDGTRFLLETHEVSACVSSRLLQLCMGRPRRPGHSALVLAHTNGGRLPAVLEEARAVAALLPGECFIEDQATCTALLSAAGRHPVIHLAAHGEARLDNPTFAHIQLADRQLGTVDVFNLPLQGALVTLSACETGRGTITDGNELIGLTRGFLYAGASTLVQSLWLIEDDAAAHTMGHFYRAICEGRTTGSALRDAQRAMLASHGVHPYFWAPFQLIGDAGPL